MPMEVLSWYISSFGNVQFPSELNQSQIFRQTAKQNGKDVSPKIGVQQEHTPKANRVSNIPTRKSSSEGRDDAETLAESRNRGEETLCKLLYHGPSI